MGFEEKLERDISVGEIVAVKASKNRAVQQPSTNSLQQVQYQSLANNKIRQGPTRFDSGRDQKVRDSLRSVNMRQFAKSFVALLDFVTGEFLQAFGAEVLDRE